MSNVTTQLAATYGKVLLGVAIEPGEIGRRIAAARKARNWTQLQFATEAGISPSTVHKWERGQIPPVRELMRVADILGIDPCDLVEPDEPGSLSDRLGRV